MIRRARWNAVVVCVCAGALTTAAAAVRAQEPRAPAGEDRWVNVDGVRIHYFDFGGQGLPLILVHSEGRTAETYRSFGQGIGDEYHVLAVTRPGYGRSEAPQQICEVERQAEYLIGFMDALEIPRAAFAGNSAPSAEMTYLAQHHPHRVAGVIFLSGPPTFGIMELEALDTTGVYRAIRRGFPVESTSCLRQRSEWRPRYLSAGMARIEVPALMFVGSSGLTGNPLNFPLAFVGSSMLDDVFSRMPASDDRGRFEQLRRNEELRRAFLDGIADSTARATLRRLDRDKDLQARVHRFHQDVLLAAAEEQERLAMEAFAARRVVRLDLPVVSGYEYRDAPELIEPHIRRFLDGLEASVDRAAARTGAGRRRVVHVAPPSTDHETDRASILAALEAAQPGDTIQFAPGTYLIGAMIRVEAPRVTLLGHPGGTTLRGCEAADREERHAALTCQGLELTGGHQTVRRLTFEETHFALVIGCCALGPSTGEESPATQPGGYLIEDNIFRRSRTGVRVQAGSSEPTVIRGNTFRNLGHAVTINGGTNHVLDNDVSAPEPSSTPVLGNPIGAIGILPVPPTRECGANIIAGNRIEGHPDAIDIIVAVPGTICRGNVIRNNTIRVRRVRYREPRFTMGSPADSTIVGIPIAVTHIAGRPDLPRFPGFEGEAFIGDNVIEGNRIEGGFGLGIEIRGSDGNRIANNTIRGIERREPFPGNTANSADPLLWQHANGSGIWVSAGSSRNTIVDNEFADIAAAAVMLDGDSTVVQLRSSGDEVRDRGSANRVNRPADTVHVAAPTGDTDTDRASILVALEEVQPGGTIQFAPGTYLVGEVVRIETPRITLLGHAEGTTLRGCNPDEYEQAERDFVQATATAGAAAAREAATRCGMLELTGGDVTVRGFTFEYSRMGLILGCCQFELMFRNTQGGYLIEGNTFRNSLNGIRPFTTERSVIRGNRFVNTFHAISGAGSLLHVLDNEISVPEPEQVPVIGHPSFAFALGPLPRRAAESMALDANGEGNVIAGNRIEGHPDGIYIAVPPGTSFRNNVIRGNTIIVDRIRLPPSGARPYIVDVTDESDPTIVGIPLALYSVEGRQGSPDVETAEGTFDDNLIEGNQLIGAEGVAIAVHRGSRNRIVGNTITGIRSRDPFPGNTVLSSERWRVANGSGIWISPGSSGNEIVANSFESIAAWSIVLEGDSNRVVTRNATERVRDLGQGNLLSGSTGAAGSSTIDDAAAPRVPDGLPGSPDRLDRLIAEHMEALGIPGLSLVVMRDGTVLERLDGRAIEEYVAEEFAEPLGLNRKSSPAAWPGFSRTLQWQGKAAVLITLARAWAR